MRLLAYVLVHVTSVVPSSRWGIMRFCCGASALELFEDVVGLLGPDEGLRVEVVLGDVAEAPRIGPVVTGVPSSQQLFVKLAERGRAVREVERALSKATMLR